MIVEVPVIRQVGRLAVLSAAISNGRGALGNTRVLEYMVPLAFEDWLSPRADAFAALLLVPCMNRAEPLEVRGPVSPRLLQGLDAYQRVFAEWFPDRLSTIELRCEDVSIAPAPEPGYVASAFSGGLDSFHTLKSSRGFPAPSRPSHAIFVHGFDVPLGREADHEVILEANRRAVNTVGVTLIPVRTNVRKVAFDWELCFGSALRRSAVISRGMPLVRTVLWRARLAKLRVRSLSGALT